MQKKEYTQKVSDLAQVCLDRGKIDTELYGKYDVQRGLRDKNGNGVLAGLTKVSKIESNKIVNGEKVPVRRPSVLSWV